MSHTLIASLGESPIVVTAMYDLLTKKYKLQIDKIMVFRSDSYLVSLGFDFIKEVLRDKCEVVSVGLGFEDPSSEEDCYKFLNIMTGYLRDEQDKNNTVYLSLAGGRKNMSAIMALLVPLFPCVKELYHVLDKDEYSTRRNFKSIEYLYEHHSDVGWADYFFPDHEHLKPVRIPYGKHRDASMKFLGRLTKLTPENLDRLWDENPLKALNIVFAQKAMSPAGIHHLEVWVTQRVAEQFRDIWRKDYTSRQEFKHCFKLMHFAAQLRDHTHDIYSRKLNKKEQSGNLQDLHSLTFHFVKRGEQMQPRPTFYTLPRDVKNCKDDEVDKVIVINLDMEFNNDYEELENIANSVSLKPYILVEDLLEELQRKSSNSDHPCTLLVPLGRSPMIATQLYTLLKHQGHDIRQVVLVYPSGAANSARIARQAFTDKGIKCTPKLIDEIADIDSEKACEIYERKLEEVIGEIRQQNPEHQIDLALSGGRKGMAALAMFVAQRKGIHHLYHTLIKDEKLSQEIEEQTTISALDPTEVTKRERNNRLFLRDYADKEDYSQFECFRVPVFPIEN